MRHVRPIIALGLAVLALHCSDATGPSVFDRYLELAPRSVLLFEGDTLRLTAQVFDTLGNALPQAGVTFESRDTTLVRTAPREGGRGTRLTGVLSGSTYVVARSGSARDSALVTVVITRSAVAGVPFGAAISPSGAAYVTLPWANRLARATLPNTSFLSDVSLGDLPSDVQFNRVGTRAYVSDQYSQSIAVVDVTTGSWVDTIPVTGDAFKVLVAPGDSILWVTTNADSVYAIRLATHAVVARLATGAAANGFAARDSMVWVSTRAGGTVLEVNAKTYTINRTFVIGGYPQELIVPPHGDQLYIANEAGSVQTLDLASGTVVSTIPLPGGGGFAMARNPANGLLYVSTGYFSSTVWVIDPATPTIVRRIITGGVPRRIAFNAAGTVGIVANEANWVDFIR